jgi:hypothetical protein
MPERVIYNFNPIYKAAELAMYATVQWSVDCVIRYWISIHQSNTTQATKFGCTDTNFEIEAPISIWRLSVNDFKMMNNESYIRITLSNVAALLARANVLVSQIRGANVCKSLTYVRNWLSSFMVAIQKKAFILLFFNKDHEMFCSQNRNSVPPWKIILKTH